MTTSDKCRLIEAGFISEILAPGNDVKLLRLPVLLKTDFTSKKPKQHVRVFRKHVYKLGHAISDRKMGRLIQDTHGPSQILRAVETLKTGGRQAYYHGLVSRQPFCALRNSAGIPHRPSEEILVARSSEVLRADEGDWGEYGAVPEWKGGENWRPPRKPADQRHRPAGRVISTHTWLFKTEIDSYRRDISFVTNIRVLAHRRREIRSVKISVSGSRHWPPPVPCARVVPTQLERVCQKQSSDTHKTPYDRVKRYRERKINIKAPERVNTTRSLEMEQVARRRKLTGRNRQRQAVKNHSSIRVKLFTRPTESRNPHGRAGNRTQSLTNAIPNRGRGYHAARTLASYLGLNRVRLTTGIAPGFSQVGIVPDDAAGLRILSGISCPPPPAPFTFRYFSVLTSTHPHRLSRLRCFTHSPNRHLLRVERRKECEPSPTEERKMNPQKIRQQCGTRENDKPCRHALVASETLSVSIIAAQPASLTTPLHGNKFIRSGGLAFSPPSRRTQALSHWHPTSLFTPEMPFGLTGSAKYDGNSSCNEGEKLAQSLLRSAPHHYPHPTWANRVRFPAGSLSHVGMGPDDDAAGRRVFSGVSRPPSHFIPALLRTRLVPPASALKTSTFNSLGQMAASGRVASPTTPYRLVLGPDCTFHLPRPLAVT
ncbi:hypothetical protein PR048_030316 [Dryococelus australis]|uniref:Ribosomal protein S4 n=1 Tax=Dryococelus australis TaxID=614101 RepID=A0ABQ9G8N2_9NEOP|nr:hypothetical protein PR048_030316 [Dryococelus australis]